TAAKAAWAPTLVSSLIKSGQYGRARAVWAMASNVQLTPGQPIYDAAFNDSKARPPFNWDLVSSTVGLAERQSGGRLHVIFYGQEDGTLASQLLVLPAGIYRLRRAVSGGQAPRRAFNWAVGWQCSATPVPAAQLDSA